MCWRNFSLDRGVQSLISAIMTVMPKILTVKSPAFDMNSTIPAEYTCDGSGVSPELIIGNIPPHAQSLAIIVEDPDAPHGTFDHWLMWNIGTSGKIHEGTAAGVQGKNGHHRHGYMGPCPPSGVHHYHFKVFALDTRLDLPGGSDKKSLISAMQGHIIAQGELIGLYGKK